jgi:hypothetical protein
MPINSPRCTIPSRFASDQQEPPAVVLHGSFDRLLPHVSVVCVNRPVSEFASVIFVS